MTCPACGRPLPTAALEGHPGGCECPGCLAACWAGWGHREACEARQRELIDLARAIPPRALAELVRVLKFGGAKHGCGSSEPGGGQGAEDHATHARAHLLGCEDYQERDRDTGALDLVHAAARCLLAAEMVMAGEETGR